jgi:hypothetical protein
VAHPAWAAELFCEANAGERYVLGAARQSTQGGKYCVAPRDGNLVVWWYTLMGGGGVVGMGFKLSVALPVYTGMCGSLSCSLKL